MSRMTVMFLAVLACAGPAPARGLLIPADTSVPPLALVRHEVKMTLHEQVASTEVTQVFHNHTDRPLEATYVFPVPKGASVNKFVMWVDGKEVKGEMVEADRARQIYTDIVRRTQDPGLLEYVGGDVLRLRVFPVPASGEQKLALRFTAVCPCEGGLVEYTYPLRSEHKSAEVHGTFRLDATVKSKARVHNVYSPSHPVKVTPRGDHESKVVFEAKDCKLDRDFRLFFAAGDKDVGLTALAHRPEADADGYCLLMISPRAELAKTKTLPRDLVFVLDTSGSMAGAKMEQGKKALKFCLDSLRPDDRFTVLNFATAVGAFSTRLHPAGKKDVEKAKRWVDGLEPTGGTAIDAALTTALDLRPKDAGGRLFTIVFFTDGQPTVGVTEPEAILKHAADRNSDGTRVFTFGVGDDVNAALLDRLADQTRSASAYVRPEEDIEVKVSGLYSKITHPVLTDLKLTTGKGVTLTEVYPAKLPDLFHGSQLVVLARYRGKGHWTVRLSGMVEDRPCEFVHEMEFPGKTGEERSFVENLWARRKVAYLLDQIRANGTQKELVDEVVSLAKKHGIATPYTSYLVVPDTVAQGTPAPGYTLPQPALPPGGSKTPEGWYLNGGYELHPSAAYPTAGAGYAINVTNSTVPGSPTPVSAPAPVPTSGNVLRVFERGGAMPPAVAAAPLPQAGKAGVELALELNELRTDNRAAPSASVRVAGRTCLRMGEVWIDEGFKNDMKTIPIKAQGQAYFRLLERRPELKELFRLGNRLVWVTPSGVALVIDPDKGTEKLSDAQIDRLFKTAR